MFQPITIGIFSYIAFKRKKIATTFLLGLSTHVIVFWLFQKYNSQAYNISYLLFPVFVSTTTVVVFLLLRRLFLEFPNRLRTYLQIATAERRIILFIVLFLFVLSNMMVLGAYVLEQLGVQKDSIGYTSGIFYFLMLIGLGYWIKKNYKKNVWEIAFLAGTFEYIIGTFFGYFMAIYMRIPAYRKAYIFDYPEELKNLQITIPLYILAQVITYLTSQLLPLWIGFKIGSKTISHKSKHKGD